MALALKSTCFVQLKKPKSFCAFRSSRMTMATLSTVSTIGISKTFAKLKKECKVREFLFFFFLMNSMIIFGDPDLSMTAQALKLLDSCGSDIIELGVPYSDPLADGLVIQAATTRSLARGTDFDAVISMLKEVRLFVLSSPVALFTYYNLILKRGVEKFMSIVNNARVRGLVVPDVPLEETEILRNEALKYKIKLSVESISPYSSLWNHMIQVLLTTPTTPTSRMKAIVEASEGFVYLVSSIGVTGAQGSVNAHVEILLRDIKEEVHVTSSSIMGFLPSIQLERHLKMLQTNLTEGVFEINTSMGVILKLLELQDCRIIK
ncbi:hypothetical protein ACJRO7_027169 [Eucalyptus globulus]|uniref:tryptophan synthase n=1 Tax=Eucalyptus globulus TaxID=34317 RepID=A0ABD3JV95_EUCGL